MGSTSMGTTPALLAPSVSARQAGISLSLHAPYFINLANPDPESLRKTTGYIIAGCQVAGWMGADRAGVEMAKVDAGDQAAVQGAQLQHLVQVSQLVDLPHGLRTQGDVAKALGVTGGQLRQLFQGAQIFPGCPRLDC